MKKFSCLTLLFSLSYFNSYTQQTINTDSLKLVFESDMPYVARLESCVALVDAFIESEDSVAVMHFINKGMDLAEYANKDKIKNELRIKEAYLLFRRDQYKRAGVIYEEVLQKSRAAGWKDLMAKCINVMGIIEYNQSNNEKALPLLNEAFAIQKEIGDIRGQGRSKVDIGRIYVHQGEPKKALLLFEEGLQHSKKTGDVKNIVRSYNDIGITYGMQGNLEKASDYFYKGLEIAEKEEILDGLSQTYGNLGFMYKLKREYEKAEYYYLKRKAIAAMQNDRMGAALALSTLGALYLDQGKYDKSLEYLEKSNAYFEDLKHKLNLSKNYFFMASIQKKLGDYDKSAFYLRKAISIGEETKATKSLAINYSALGNLLLEQNLEDSAFIYYKKSFQLLKQIKSTNVIIASYRDIGQIYGTQAKLPKALEFYKKALEETEASNDTLGASDIYSMIADVYFEQGCYDQAFSNYKAALKGYTQKQVNSNSADMNLKLAKVFNSQQKYKQALHYGRTALQAYNGFNDQCAYGSAYLTLAKSYNGLQHTDSIKVYLNKALSNALECKNVQSPLLASVYGDLGAFYLQQQKKDSAFVAYEAALKYASLSQNRLVMKNAAEALYPIYEAKGQQAKAYETFKIFHESSEALYNEKNTRALVQQEYEKQLQEKALIQKQKEAALAKQKWIIASMIVVCLAFLMIAFAFYNNYRDNFKANKLLRAKNKEISKQREELRALDETKSRFFANISHELRTPLTLISSPIQSLLKNTKETFLPATRETLQLMYRNAESLKLLVNDILDLSKLESDKMELNQQEVPIRKLLSRVASSFDSIAKHQGITYLQYFEELPDVTLKLDIYKTEKVLSNLLSNATKNTPAGGIIIMVAAAEDGQLKITVKDTGSGIDQADLPYIFDRFYQSKQPDLPLQGGTGIGLALAKEFCQFMGGSIEVSSALNEGTTFTVCLPYKVVENSSGVLETEPLVEEKSSLKVLKKQHAGSARQHKILIVEDHPDMQAYVNSLIAPSFKTFLAANGKEALKILKNKEVDLIISDVMMPEMDGYTLLQSLKESEAYHHIPVIILTALGDESHKLQALTIGVDDYLTKPFSPDELLVRVHNLLARYEARLKWRDEEEKAEVIAVALSEILTNDENATVSTHALEAAWLKQVEREITANLENEDFRLADLAEQFNLSSRQFLRRIKKLTGLSVKQYQQEIALQKARKLLEEGTYGNATAVAYSIGMNHVTRFSKLYEARFGKKPGDYFASFSTINGV